MEMRVIYGATHRRAWTIWPVLEGAYWPVTQLKGMLGKGKEPAQRIVFGVRELNQIERVPTRDHEQVALDERPP